MHVDDFAWRGTEDFKQKVILKLKQEFNFGKIASPDFKFLGLDVVSKEKALFVTQKTYSSSINRIDLAKGRASMKNSELNEVEAGDLKSLIGQIS